MNQWVEYYGLGGGCQPVAALQARMNSDFSHKLRLQPEEVDEVGGSTQPATQGTKAPAKTSDSSEKLRLQPEEVHETGGSAQPAGQGRTQNLRLQPQPPVATGGSPRSRRICTTSRPCPPKPPTSARNSGCNRRKSTKPEGLRSQPAKPNPKPPTPATTSGCNRRNSTKSEGLLPQAGETVRE